MREREAWEEKIKNALALECGGVTPSRDLKDRIDRQILESQKEAGNMKKFSMKKLVIGVAAGCLLVSGGVFAAGRVGRCHPIPIWETLIKVIAIWIRRRRNWDIR